MAQSRKETYNKFLARPGAMILKVITTLFIIIMITGSICAIAFSSYLKDVAANTPDIPLDAFELNYTSIITYTDKRTGEQIELERLYGEQNRIWVNFSEIPKCLKDAFISVEDERFSQHHGVDWRRTFSVVVGQVLPVGSGGGGSTITQQLIKNITGKNEVSAKRKLSEIFSALNLEKKLSKDRILELYLNTINLGQGCYGVKSAANVYFGKDVSELTIAESALLAGITKWPVKYDPYNNYEASMDRKETVLGQMLRNEKISQEEYDAALAEKMVFLRDVRAEEAVVQHSYFVDQLIDDVTDDLVDKFGYSKQMATKLLYSGGLHIFASIDMDVQNALDEVYKDPSNFPVIKDKNGDPLSVQPESAMAVMSTDGRVVGLVGGRGEKVGNRLLNRATQSLRQPGSSIKPIAVYGPALELGVITPYSVLTDAPIRQLSGKPWPSNSTNGGRYLGQINMMDAIRNSVNTVATEIVQMITPAESINFLQNRFHIDSLVLSSDNPKTNDESVAPVALGGLTKGVSPLNMCAAYLSFANKGVYIEPRTYTKVLNSNGEVLLGGDGYDGSVAVSEKTAAYMTMMLKKAVDNGTGSASKIKNIDTAGKTGTTSENYDRWFVGYTPYYVGATWFGFDLNKNLGNISPNPALMAWKKVMDIIHEGKEPAQFEVPSSFVSFKYCLDSGLLPGEYCGLDPRGDRIATGLLAPEDIPKKKCDVHVPAQLDSVTNQAATPFCPLENLKTISLLNLERTYYGSYKIEDEQYIMKYYKEGEAYPIPGESPPPINSFCSQHRTPTSSIGDPTTPGDTNGENPEVPEPPNPLENSEDDYSPPELYFTLN